MFDSAHDLGFLRELIWQDIVLILAVLIASRLLVMVARQAVRRVAEIVPARRRLVILPVLVEPTFHNTVALIATVGLALAFAFKDYGSCLIAGVVTIVENPYQPGDWIEIGGHYGEVTAVGLRAVHMVTADDTEIIIPHSQLWSASIANASSGKRSLLCVALFYLEADHDGAAVRQRLGEIAEQSRYREPDSKVVVIAMEKPWGTLYRLKAYVHESREQFLFITDLTLRGKEALREMNIRFARAPYAETEKS